MLGEIVVVTVVTTLEDELDAEEGIEAELEGSDLEDVLGETVLVTVVTLTEELEVLCEGLAEVDWIVDVNVETIMLVLLETGLTVDEDDD